MWFDDYSFNIPNPSLFSTFWPTFLLRLCTSDTMGWQSTNNRNALVQRINRKLLLKCVNHLQTEILIWYDRSLWALHRNIIWFSQNAHSSKHFFFKRFCDCKFKTSVQLFLLSKKTSGVCTKPPRKAEQWSKFLHFPHRLKSFSFLLIKSQLQNATQKVQAVGVSPVSLILPVEMLEFDGRKLFVIVRDAPNVCCPVWNPEEERTARDSAFLSMNSVRPSVSPSVVRVWAWRRPPASGYTSDAVSVELRTMVVRIL